MKQSTPKGESTKRRPETTKNKNETGKVAAENKSRKKDEAENKIAPITDARATAEDRSGVASGMAVNVWVVDGEDTAKNIARAALAPDEASSSANGQARQDAKGSIKSQSGINSERGEIQTGLGKIVNAKSTPENPEFQNPEAKRAKKDEIEAVRKDAESGRDLTFEEALNKRDVQQIDAAVENIAKRAKCKISAPNTTRAEPQEVEEKDAHEQPDDEGEQLEREAEYNAMVEDQPEARMSTCNDEGTTEEGKDGNRQMADTY